MFGATQTQYQPLNSGTGTQYYDSSFPQPMGSAYQATNRGPYESQPMQTRGVAYAAGAAPVASQPAQGSTTREQFNSFIGERENRDWILFICAGIVALVALIIFIQTIISMLSGSFLAYSGLAWAAGSWSFWCIALVIVIVILLAIAICIAIMYAAKFKNDKHIEDTAEPNPLFRPLAFVAYGLGGFLLFMALLGWFGDMYGRDGAVRAGNNICQDADATLARLSCPATPAARRRLESEWIATYPLDEVTEVGIVRTVPARRLATSPYDAAQSYLDSLGTGTDRCAKVTTMCSLTTTTLNGCWCSMTSVPGSVTTTAAHAAGISTLTTVANAGATTLQVADQSSFILGSTVQIASGTLSETKGLVGFGSLILDSPLLYGYPEGALVTMVSPTTSTTTAVPTSEAVGKMTFYDASDLTVAQVTNASVTTFTKAYNLPSTSLVHATASFVVASTSTTTTVAPAPGASPAAPPSTTTVVAPPPTIAPTEPPSEALDLPSTPVPPPARLLHSRHHSGRHLASTTNETLGSLIATTNNFTQTIGGGMASALSAVSSAAASASASAAQTGQMWSVDYTIQCTELQYETIVRAATVINESGAMEAQLGVLLKDALVNVGANAAELNKTLVIESLDKDITTTTTTTITTGSSSSTSTTVPASAATIAPTPATTVATSAPTIAPTPTTTLATSAPTIAPTPTTTLAASAPTIAPTPTTTLATSAPTVAPASSTTAAPTTSTTTASTSGSYPGQGLPTVAPTSSTTTVTAAATPTVAPSAAQTAATGPATPTVAPSAAQTAATVPAAPTMPPSAAQTTATGPATPTVAPSAAPTTATVPAAPTMPPSAAQTTAAGTAAPTPTVAPTTVAPTPAPTPAAARILQRDVSFLEVHTGVSAHDGFTIGSATARALSTPNQAQRGSYCYTWDVGDVADWCFVSSTGTCASKTDFEGYMKSTDPCTSAVDSRSEYVLVGQSEAVTVLRLACLLGFIVLALGFCAMYCYNNPGRYLCWEYAWNSLSIEEQQSAKLLGWTEKSWNARESVPDQHVPWDSLPPAKRQAFMDLGWTSSTYHGGARDLKGAISANLQEEFERAQEEVVVKLKDTTPDFTKLQVYGYYKQAQIGDCVGPPPDHSQPREVEKYNAWNKNRGMSKAQAMQEYIKLAHSIPG